MFEKSLVFAFVPSSTSEKLDNGEGDAVKPNDVAPFGVACLTTLIEPGKTTASFESERSWLPPLPSRSTRRMWKGEPEMLTAERLAPQFGRVAMWPAQARTGFAPDAVNVIAIRADLSPLNPAPRGW